MNYDTMSVDELFDEMDSDVVEGYPRDEKKVIALRKAVTKEASVGTLTKTKRQKGSLEWNVPDKDFHAGIYDVIPREDKRG